MCYFLYDGLVFLTHRLHLLKCAGIFYRLKNKLPKRPLENIYFAFVHPYILYVVQNLLTN